MTTRSTNLTTLSRLAEMCSATVLSIDGSAAWIDVGDGRRRSARLAGVAVEPGSEVVAAGSDDAGWFVLATVGAPGPVARTIRLADGTAAVATADGTSLEFRRGDGSPLFRYESDGEQGRVVLESTDLELRSDRTIRIRSGGDVALEGRRVVSRAVDAAGRVRSELRVEPDAVGIQARETSIASTTVRAEAERFDVVGEAAHVRMGRLVLAARRLETIAETVVETARNVYRKVRELSQTRAGRIRTIADGDAQFRARRVVHVASESYKIKSDKIHLA
jgi:hypothetical protein